MPDAAWARHSQALPNIQFQTLNSPLLSFIQPGSREDLDVSAPYQRGSVWSPAQQASLIRSLIMNIPIGGIYRARFDVPGRGQYYRIVDGKQRLEALWAFVDGRLRVPADWFGDREVEPSRVDRAGLVAYGDLTPYGRRGFDMHTVAVLDFVSDHEMVEVAAGSGTHGGDRQFIYRQRTPAEAIAYEAMVYGLINSTGSAQTAESLARAARIARGGR